MIYIDSNIFIYSVVAKSDKQISLSKNILLKITERKFDAATSVLTWDEFVWVVRKTLGQGLVEIEGSKFLNLPNLKFIAVEESTIREAQRLVGKYTLKPRDAIHVATAISHGISQIISDDPDFDKVAELERIGLEKAGES